MVSLFTDKFIVSGRKVLKMSIAVIASFDEPIEFIVFLLFSFMLVCGGPIYVTFLIFVIQCESILLCITYSTDAICMRANLNIGTWCNQFSPCFRLF